MSLFKVKVYRNKKLLNASRGRSCSFCGNDDGTTVRAHYSGKFSARFGKGMGIKPHDHVSADACGKCHIELDEHKHSPEEESEMWFFAIMETMRRDLEGGVIK